jgi:lipopolysaccharide export LptBFGC system permease protein LptF
VLCLAYFILFRIGLALGTGGKLAPMAAAWLPNAIFAAIGLGLSWRLR